MPELPEVETTRQGIAPFIVGKSIEQVAVYNRALRWVIPEGFESALQGQRIESVERIAKYLLLKSSTGTLLIHLGMSGYLRLVCANTLKQKHDHVDLLFDEQTVLRFNDTRRFGAMLWTAGDVRELALIKRLGIEPLSAVFNGQALHALVQNRQVPIKTFIMNAQMVVGIGNIYANEALFRAGILPTRPAGSLTQGESETLVHCLKTVLSDAIKQGGTTLRDFKNPQGKSGYFQQTLSVYGKKNGVCVQCLQTLQRVRLNGRSTFFCVNCQQ